MRRTHREGQDLETRIRSGRAGLVAGEGLRPARLSLVGAGGERRDGAVVAGVRAGDHHGHRPASTPPTSRFRTRTARACAATARCRWPAVRSRWCWSPPRSSASTTTSRTSAAASRRRATTRSCPISTPARPISRRSRPSPRSCRSSTASTTPSSSPTTTPPSSSCARASRATSTGWRSPASAAAGARRSSTPRQTRGSRRRRRGTARSAAPPTSSRRARRWTASPRTRCRCWGCTRPRTPAFRSSRCEKYFAALKAAGTPAELVVYPDAGHGFHADFRADNYRKADAEDAWKRMLDWFRKYGVA